MLPHSNRKYKLFKSLLKIPNSVSNEQSKIINVSVLIHTVGLARRGNGKMSKKSKTTKSFFLFFGQLFIELNDSKIRNKHV